MADWKNVHLAEKDKKIAELEMERAECQHELVALRYTLDDLVAHQRRRAEVAEARVREMEAFKARAMEWARGRCGACGHEGSEGDTCYDCNSDDERSNWTPPKAWEVGE